METSTRLLLRQLKYEEKARKKADADNVRASMKYRGLINIDFTHLNSNEYQKLLAALIEAGWVYLETSALVIESDLPTVLHALELVAKQCQDAVVLSALTVHVQGSSDFKGVPYRGARNGPNALAEIREKPLPRPTPPDTKS